MAHFALMENGCVNRVIVVSNDDCGGGNFRGTYAGIGYTYNPSTDTFTPPPVVEDAPE